LSAVFENCGCEWTRGRLGQGCLQNNYGAAMVAAFLAGRDVRKKITDNKHVA
jgi:hypothetical protein